MTNAEAVGTLAVSAVDVSAVAASESAVNAERAPLRLLEAATEAAIEASIFDGVIAELEKIVATVPTYRALGAPELLAANRGSAQVMKLMGTHQALIAGVIAERSTPELGGDGLAQRNGFSSVEKFVKSTTGVTGQAATQSVRTGVMMTDIEDAGKVDSTTGEVYAPMQPWLTPVSRALTDGVITAAAADAITRGLGVPNSAATAELLEAAAIELCIESSRGVDPDTLFKHARSKRDELDLAGVALREEELYKARKFRMWARVDGMWEVRWLLAPEDGALLKEVYDRIVSPKLGHVRFVNEEQKAKAEAIKTDDRTPEQFASDGMLHLVEAGVDADSSRMLGSGAPIIRITTMREAEPIPAPGAGPAFSRPAASRPGASRPIGRIDGQSDPVSATTVDRLRCGGSTRTIVFDQYGHIVETESEQRLFSPRQREALAAKFGGCMDPNCDLPPSWTEAHHIEFFKRDKGKTVLANGILLCKFHHLLYHNQGYEIKIDPAGNYWLIPPVTRDPAQTPVPMPLKSSNVRDLRRALAATA